jgi:hypothetical protein
MYGPKYVWFFIGWYEDDWFRNEKNLKHEKIKCTADEMSKAAEAHFTTEAQQWNQDKGPTVSGRESENDQCLGAVYTCDFAYDSVYDLLPKGSRK